MDNPRISEAIRLPRVSHESDDGREYAVPPYIAPLAFDVPSGMLPELREATERAAEVSASLRAAPEEYRLGIRLADAIANSRMERIYASTDRVARALVENAALVDEGTIAAAVTAAERAERAESITDIHAPLLLAQGGVYRQYAGIYRPVRVRIGEHLCPLPERVPDLMNDLLMFGRRAGLDPLLRATIFHGQYETIHPFADGNGRSGRAVLAADIGLPLSIPMHWKNSHRSYIAGLIAYRAGDVTPLLECVMDSVWAAADIVEWFLSRKPQLPQVRTDALAHRVASWMVARPAITSSHIVQRFEVSKMSAKRALDALEAGELVEEVTGGTRNRVFVSAESVARIDDALVSPMHRR